MKKDLINDSVSNRICNHMNLDHQDSLLAYAKFYGGVKKPSKSELIKITNENMHLLVDGKTLKIEFDHILEDSSDAHKTLVSMLKNIPNEYL